MPLKKEWLPFTPENVAQVPEKEGVYEVGDEGKNIIYIHGVLNLRQELATHFGDGDTPIDQARLFRYEEAFMYTAKESEHLRLYMRDHSSLPVCNQELI